jgi:hypothetical protein
MLQSRDFFNIMIRNIKIQNIYDIIKVSNFIQADKSIHKNFIMKILV